VVFAEMVEALPAEGGSVAMTAARGRVTSDEQGALAETRGALDRAIEGEGYFTVLTPEGEPLTRAGAFARSPDGEIVVGILQPGDISRRNEIPYDRIAGARISYGGRGLLSTAQQPRWGQQVVDRVLPF
jgi:flagellar L-ring protein precursor FlgH